MCAAQAGSKRPAPAQTPQPAKAQRGGGQPKPEPKSAPPKSQQAGPRQQQQQAGPRQIPVTTPAAAAKGGKETKGEAQGGRAWGLGGRMGAWGVGRPNWVAREGAVGHMRCHGGGRCAVSGCAFTGGVRLHAIVGRAACHVPPATGASLDPCDTRACGSRHRSSPASS